MRMNSPGKIVQTVVCTYISENNASRTPHLQFVYVRPYKTCSLKLVKTCCIS